MLPFAAKSRDHSRVVRETPGSRASRSCHKQASLNRYDSLVEFFVLRGLCVGDVSSRSLPEFQLVEVSCLARTLDLPYQCDLAARHITVNLSIAASNTIQLKTGVDVW